jgi:MYXO-CTERM domain-containing protein
VTRNLTCTTSADCGGGDVCLQGICVAPSGVNARAGGYGCSSGSGAPTGLWALLALALIVRRSRRRPVSPSVTRAGVGLALLLAASSASAQTPAAFYLQTFEPTPAGDLFLVSPEAPVADRGPAAALVLSWATDPLVLRTNGAAIPGGKIVHRQFWGWVTASLPLFDRVLLDVAAPVALRQSGSQPFPDLAPVTSTAFGDLRIGARVPFYQGSWGSLAGAVDAWIATGSVAAFASDAAFRFEPKLIASGEAGAVAWSGSVGYHFRPELDVGYAILSRALTYTAGGAWRIGEFRVGPEIFGRFASGSGASPVEGLLGGGWARGEWDTSLAVGTAFDNAAGAAPYRLLGRVTWQPGKGAASKAAALAAAEKRRAEEQAAEEAAFKKAAASVEAARRAELARAEADRAAAAKREADRLAAEAAAAKAAAEASSLAKLRKGKIEINRPIQFEIARDVILESSAPALQAVAAIMKDHPEITRLRIDGHTDASGSAGLNLVLSENRAQSVRNWLIKRGGIDAGRLEAKGHGHSRPVADNATMEGRAANRRVDFVVLP